MDRQAQPEQQALLEQAVPQAQRVLLVQPVIKALQVQPVLPVLQVGLVQPAQQALLEVREHQVLQVQPVLRE